MNQRFRSVILGLCASLLLASAPAKNDQAAKAQSNALESIARAMEIIVKRDAENDARSPSPLEKKCAPGDDDRQSDLCAQWKAADAAEQSANWTRNSFWLAVFGTLIGAATLGAAIAAAKFARDAAVASQAAADLFNSAERGRLTFSGFVHGNDDLELLLTAANHGRSSATVLNIAWQQVDKPKFDLSRSHRKTVNVTVKNDDKAQIGSIPIEDAGENALYICVCITYRTLQASEFFSYYSAELRRNPPGGEMYGTSRFSAYGQEFDGLPADN